MKVVVKPLAMITIDEIVKFIVTEIQMPETGKKYGRKMLEFAYSLDVNWKAYPTCHHKPYNYLFMAKAL